MWVIKIGGSLAHAAALPQCLAALSAERARRWVIVPGGGPFADAVRGLQTHWGFGDALAHRMAIQAMGIYGLALHALEPTLRLESSVSAAASAPDAVIWTPLAAELHGVAEDWRVCADAIALWLAQQLGAQGLLLLKSAPPPQHLHRAGDLAAANYVDAAFPELLRTAACPAYWTLPADFIRCASLSLNPVSAAHLITRD